MHSGRVMSGEAEALVRHAMLDVDFRGSHVRKIPFLAAEACSSMPKW